MSRNEPDRRWDPDIGGFRAAWWLAGHRSALDPANDVGHKRRFPLALLLVPGLALAAILGGVLFTWWTS